MIKPGALAIISPIAVGKLCTFFLFGGRGVGGKGKLSLLSLLSSNILACTFGLPKVHVLIYKKLYIFFRISCPELVFYLK